MHVGVGAILGLIAGGAVGYFVLSTVSEGIPGRGEFETAAIAASNRRVVRDQSAPAVQRIVREEKAHPIPCYGREPSNQAVAAMGVSGPQREAIRSAYAASSERIWTAFAEPCRKTLGVESMAIIDRMGLLPCFDLVRAQGDVATVEALTRALMGEYAFFMRDIARDVGDAEAERLASSGRICLDTKLLRDVR